MAQSDSMPLTEAVHELRIIRDRGVRSAISEMIDLLATGQLPPADALIDGMPTTIDPRWWWVGAIEYPNNSATFSLIADGEERLTRATEIALDRTAWGRQKSRMTVDMQQDSWNDPAWDRPVKLLDAIRLWSPAFARHLDQVKWVSTDETRDLAQRRRRTDSPIGAGDDLADPGIPGALRDDWARLVSTWNEWDDTDRLIHSFELAGRLIIEKTRRGQPYILKFAPPASHDGLDDDYQRVGDARHDALGPYDFDLANSMIKRPRGNWLPVRVLGGTEAEGERLRATRLAREARDAAATAAWAALRSGKMRDRQLFGYDEVADALARKPGSLEIDAAERDRILRNLDDWTRGGEFELGGESEVIILTGERPYLAPLHPRPPLPPGAVEIPTAPDMRMLRRSACRRYVESSPLEGASRLLREWFPEIFEPGDNSLSLDEGKATAASLHSEIAPRGKAPVQKRQRAAYSVSLELWMSQQKLSVLQRMGAAAIARQFKSHCDQHLPEVVPLLPQRLRSVENVIERIINRRRDTARTKNSGPNVAGNGQ